MGRKKTPIEEVVRKLRHSQIGDAIDRAKWLRLPVVSAGAEHLVMGYLMRRNILAYKAPQNNEGYDLICIHPDIRGTGREGISFHR